MPKGGGWSPRSGIGGRTGPATGYGLQQFVVRQDAGGWRADVRETACRALRRSELDEALGAAGLSRVRWLVAEESGHDQPIVIARKP